MFKNKWEIEKMMLTNLCRQSGSLVFAIVMMAIGPLAICSSVDSVAEDYGPVVIERLGRATETPAWAYGAKVMWQVKDSVIFAYSLEMSGESRPDVCMKAASLQARTEMRRYISEAISSSEIMSQANLISDPEFESVTVSIAQGSIAGTSVKEQYWEKVLKTDVRGEKRLRMQCSSQVQVTRADLDRQLEQKIIVETAKNPEMRRALITAQTDFLNNLD
ncbi:hypothetical protein OAV86_02775 [Pseudomonadales bacterium]|jgi:hypothetical protein|nr:hypothetical protein [Pseudomonadales bacterium]